VYGADGLPLEKITPSGATYWYHHDQLGSTRSFTDASGTPQATYTYDSYGNLTASTGAVANPLRFAGEYTDTESGLVYLRGRYFEPGTGQFLTRDPLEDVTRAPYGYAQENPLNLVDHTGQSAQGATGYQAAPKPPGMSDYDYQGYLHLVSDMNTWTCEDAQRAQQAAQEKAKHDAFEARLASLHAAEADARAADLNAPDLISDMASHVDTSVVKGAANTVNQALVTYGRSCMTGALGIGGAAVAAGLVSAGVGTVVVAGGGCLVTVGEQVVVQRLS
jgi:RHS repeat-associated protein